MPSVIVSLRRALRTDLTASLVVFLVALPLCVGVAVASGVPAEPGLVTGIVGGLVTGFLPGSRLQVSGPAAGLTVLVFEAVREYGLATLGVIVLATGLLQLLLGALGFGRAHGVHLDGRRADAGIAFTGEAGQLKMLAEFRRGESDLVLRDGCWFLVATCEVPARPLNTEPSGWVGVDRGIVNLAITSDGDNFSGRRLGRYRRWQARVRAETPDAQSVRCRCLRRQCLRWTGLPCHAVPDGTTPRGRLAGQGGGTCERTGQGGRTRLWPA